MCGKRTDLPSHGVTGALSTNADKPVEPAIVSPRPSPPTSRRVRDYLTLTGTDPWLDVRDIPAGADWKANLEAAIKDADGIVMILTPQALESAYVREGARLAQEYQKVILPLLPEAATLPACARSPGT